ncbi:hypothetical protein B0A49_01064 [Cryomyces minteri]|uniref:AHC1-like C2H2 zinc-finger domain-containing protein n=1 Tax=Cryomyces minteri TaxID=331657 RepID=A0A4U0XVL5_9PEZI|nr:hypothetical protein B0A49_01064 [Cryomyces minteri]
MQTIFRLPWCTDPGSDKCAADKAAFHKPRPIPLVEMSMLNKLKRKRTDSPEPASLMNSVGGVIKKRRNSAHGRNAQSLGKEAEVLNHVASASRGMGEEVKVQDTKTASPPARQHEMVEQPIAKEHHDTSAITPVVPPISPTQLEQPPVTLAAPTTTQSMAPPRDTSMDLTSRVTPLQQAAKVVDAEFCMEILFKHDELRLIEQELAKCQVALECLRRCHYNPYPGVNSPSENVSNGVGPALQPPPGYTRPRYPTPYGVNDNMYTRHYARWLPQDPQFDPAPVRQAMTHNSGGQSTRATEGRSTRNSTGDGAAASNARSSRGSGSNFSALPDFPPSSSRDKTQLGPLVIRRAADGQHVKLICNDCERGDFSSIQGFLNHCRIKHHKDYKSHEAAAVDCGRSLDADDSHAAIGGEHHDPERRPGAAAAAAASGTTSVHPLNRSELPPRKPTTKSPSTQKPRSKNTVKRDATLSTHVMGPPRPTTASADTPMEWTPTHSAQTGSSISAPGPFVPSPTEPHLSNLMKRKGFKGDLVNMVYQAKQKIDLDSVEPVAEGELANEGDTLEVPSDQQAAPTPPSGARKIATPQSRRSHKQRARMSPAPLERPSSQKGHRTAPSHLSRTNLSQANLLSTLSHEEEVPESPMDLSPHTIESNPGLISDHSDHSDADDDDDPESVAAAHHHHHHNIEGSSPQGFNGATAHLPGGPALPTPFHGRRGPDLMAPACGAEEMELDVEVEQDDEGVVIRPKERKVRFGSPSRK